MGEMPRAMLYVNGSTEDRKALEAVQAAGFPCDVRGPLGNQDTPLLLTGTSAHQGLRRIEEYLRDARAP